MRRAGRIPRRHSPEGHLRTHVLVPRGSRRSSASFPLCSGCSGSNTSCEHQPLLPSMRSSSCSLPARGPSALRGSVSATHRTARRLYGECRHLAPKSTIKAPAPIWLQGALGGGATMCPRGGPAMPCVATLQNQPGHAPQQREPETPGRHGEHPALPITWPPSLCASLSPSFLLDDTNHCISCHPNPGCPYLEILN